MAMEEKFVDAQEDLLGKEDLSLSVSKKRRSVEDNGVVFTASKLKQALERTKQELPVASDIQQFRTNQRSIRELYFQAQCSKDVMMPKYTKFLSLNENLVQCCMDLVEVRAPDSLSIICREATPFNIPLNPRSSKMDFHFDNFNSHRRTKSTSDLGNFIVERTFASVPENDIISPIERWIVHTIARNRKVREILKSPLFSHFGVLDSNASSGRATSTDIKEAKCSEPISSPSGLSSTSSQQPGTEIVPVKNQRYESETSDKIYFSCSSTNSTYSYQSTSSTSDTVSKGLIHCTWKSGLPSFVFSVDDQGEVYVAHPLKVESSDDKALDYMYSFHLRMDGEKEHGNSEGNVSDLVGKMKVSSSLTLSSNNSKLMETEFILYSAREDHAEEMQSKASAHKKDKGLSKKVADIFKTKHSYKHKSTPKFGEPRSKFGVFSHELSLDKLTKHGASGRENLDENDFPSNLELAAIVVKDNLCGGSQEAAVGGWGLKFLEKVLLEQVDTSLQSTFSSDSCQESCQRKKSGFLMNMNVLVPAGFHGGPRTRNGGPSTLIERWRSGGRCDCGGWDMGCPLTVINSKSSSAKVLPEAEDCRSFDLFIEGKQGLPMLKMVNIHEDLYFVHFQSTLSALQSFSIGVAIIHTQSSGLCPQMHRN